MEQDKSYKSMTIDFYDDKSDCSFDGELRTFPSSTQEWRFRLVQKSTFSPDGKTHFLWEGNLNELQEMILFGKLYKEQLQAEVEEKATCQS